VLCRDFSVFLAVSSAADSVDFLVVDDKSIPVALTALLDDVFVFFVGFVVEKFIGVETVVGKGDGDFGVCEKDEREWIRLRVS
jgi:hypothetical protein